MGQNRGHYLNLRKFSKNIRCSALMSGPSAGSSHCRLTITRGLLPITNFAAVNVSLINVGCYENSRKKLTRPIKLVGCQLAYSLPNVQAVGNQKDQPLQLSIRDLFLRPPPPMTQALVLIIHAERSIVGPDWL
jgi:hypothetical protein